MELNEKDIEILEKHGPEFGPNYNHVVQLFQKLCDWLSQTDPMPEAIRVYYMSLAYRMQAYACALHKQDRDDDRSLCWVLTVEADWIRRTMAEMRFMADNAQVWLLEGIGIKIQQDQNLTVAIMPISATDHQRVQDWLDDQPYGVTVAPRRWPREVISFKETGAYTPVPFKTVTNQEISNVQEQSTSNPSDSN